MADKAEANKAKNAGNVNFKNGKYEEALKNYDLAVKLDPEEVFNDFFQLFQIFASLQQLTQFMLVVSTSASTISTGQYQCYYHFK